MRTDEQREQPDPRQVQPTDNSSGAPVDLEKVEEIEEEVSES